MSTYTTQTELLQYKLNQFYEEGDHKERFLRLINGENQIPLSVIDWFATNYAKKNYTRYNIEDKNGNIVRFKVYLDYKLKLKAYSKDWFDAFCRGDHIQIVTKDGICFDTTIGQMNFFKWAFENKVLEYIEQNFEAIDRDMKNRKSTAKRKGDANAPKTRKKREELSISATKSIKKEDVEIVVTFK